MKAHQFQFSKLENHPAKFRDREITCLMTNLLRAIKE